MCRRSRNQVGFENRRVGEAQRPATAQPFMCPSFVPSCRHKVGHMRAREYGEIRLVDRGVALGRLTFVWWYGSPSGVQPPTELNGTVSFLRQGDGARRAPFRAPVVQCALGQEAADVGSDDGHACVGAPTGPDCGPPQLQRRGRLPCDPPPRRPQRPDHAHREQQRRGTTLFVPCLDLRRRVVCSLCRIFSRRWGLPSSSIAVLFDVKSCFVGVGLFFVGSSRCDPCSPVDHARVRGPCDRG